MDNNLPELVVDALRKVEVPGFDVDVVSSGVVRGFRLSEDCRKVMVYVDFSSSDPGCLFCKFINHTLWNSIINRIKEALRGIGMEEVLVLDIRRGQEL